MELATAGAATVPRRGILWIGPPILGVALWWAGQSACREAAHTAPRATTPVISAPEDPVADSVARVREQIRILAERRESRRAREGVEASVGRGRRAPRAGEGDQVIPAAERAAADR